MGRASDAPPASAASSRPEFAEDGGTASRAKRKFTETDDAEFAAPRPVAARTADETLQDSSLDGEEYDPGTDGAVVKDDQKETELVESAWGKKYKAGFVPKSSHVGNLLPADEMAKYTTLLPGRGAAAEKKEEKDKTVLDSSNAGYKLLSKMGWKAGKGLGAKEDGKVAPVGAEKGASDKSGAAAGSTHGVGSQHTWDLDGTEDVYEQYRKRMMLGYRHRPNPNNNPRKLYY